MCLSAQVGRVVTVRRLYVSDLPEEGGAVTLADSSSRHVRVLRLRMGDPVVLFDGKGRVATARIEALGDRVLCQAEEPMAVETKGPRIVLMLALPKGSKLDGCVRMATELGVDEVALMQTERSVSRWDSERTRSRVDRLTRIASEAAAQCERNDIPIVHSPRSCAAWLAAMPEDARGVLFGARAQGSLNIDATAEQVWCAVGPEGGFTEAEVAGFEGAGFTIASLGTLILRVETAVPAALSLVRDRLTKPRQAR